MWTIVYEKHFNAMSTKMMKLWFDREFRVIMDYTATIKKIKAREKRV